MNSNNLGNYDGRSDSNQPNKLRPFCINSPSDSGENGPHDEDQKRLPPDACPKYPMHLVSASNGSGLCDGIHFLENVKEHAPSLARASVGRGVKIGITLDHVNRAASDGCCVSSCSLSVFLM